MFLHGHPGGGAIFTGATRYRLTRRGARYQATVHRAALPAVGRHLVAGMRAHRSRIPASALADAAFAGTYGTHGTYGTEWFVREGGSGLLDAVADASSTGDAPAADG